MHDDGIVGPNPYDALNIEVTGDPKALAEALERKVADLGPVALAVWEPVLERVRRDPEECWWLALMARNGGKQHPLDQTLYTLRTSSVSAAVELDAESVAQHLRENLGQVHQRSSQLRELVDLPELEANRVYRAGLSAFDEED